MNYKCLPKFVRTDNASLVEKWPASLSADITARIMKCYCKLNPNLKNTGEYLELSEDHTSERHQELLAEFERRKKVILMQKPPLLGNTCNQV